MPPCTNRVSPSRSSAGRVRSHCPSTESAAYRASYLRPSRRALSISVGCARVLPYSAIVSWLPSRKCTAPPAARACCCSWNSSHSVSVTSSPRSNTSPATTRWSRPAPQRSWPSITPLARSSRVRPYWPWRSEMAMMRAPAGSGGSARGDPRRDRQRARIAAAWLDGGDRRAAGHGRPPHLPLQPHRPPGGFPARRRGRRRDGRAAGVGGAQAVVAAASRSSRHRPGWLERIGRWRPCSIRQGLAARYDGPC